MFRNISKILLRNHPIIFQQSFHQNGTAQVTRPRRPMEINGVKLMGTIENDVKRLKNNKLHLHLKTLNADRSYCIHKVSIANSNLLKMVETKLKKDQRIYIGGRLKTDNNMIGHFRHHKVEVLANELYFLDSNPIVTDVDSQEDTPPVNWDENSVELLAFIRSDVRNERNLSAFSIATNYTKNKGTSDEIGAMDFHRVLIYNDPDMIRIARNLRKNDRVYITGSINYANREFPDGKIHASGYVQPSYIVKLKKIVRNEQSIRESV